MPENRWTSVKISGDLLKCLNITGQLGKSLLLSENVWISLKISENYSFNYETVWKLLLALFIAELFSTYVLSTFYELHLRKTQKKNKRN